MQDLHSMGGSGGGRIFGAGVDRRLRPHHQSNHQALKCPRCDSVNTKFCYYNNYNLSQPRHFCKSCRRYWTKGGVLRNVPVGGGCRKTKRSSSKPKEINSDTTTAEPPRERNKSNNSHSSSESSSLTANNTTAAAFTAAAGTAEAVSAPSSSSAASNLFNVQDSKLLMVQNQNTTDNSFEPPLLEQGADCGIFSEMGNFTNLITSSNDPLLYGLNNVADISQFRMNNQQGNEQNQWRQQQMAMGMDGEEVKIQETTGGMLDQTVLAELTALQNRSNSGEFGPLDWQGSGGGGDQALFDLPSAVEDQTYWSHTQWTDQDHTNLYLP